ncbi:hypothetical protein R1T16_14005 [Flavobacterium sp. DG1-102-2]|uniref:hypothetical protein n=1 Tax=Flavobacterium sp. DG1-102-2 TaxID=3081663 RepID=UPI00294A7672|nr:hypothetical protein [Flavobacterium sp. DG1-102-2]MDV6169545.1 hypothetical protein [Flavobacterium sp. DG1-102-2]
MALLLYINGQQADLSAGQVIAQTKQVNDLNSLENRQAGYTNKFKLPKTANNLRIMNFLTVTGNDSAVPYQKNECSLYSDTGECFVYNGWAVITDGGDDYEAVIYDGIIDFYKKIEGQTLASLDLDKLTHEKNLTTVTSSWIGDDILKYKYIVADYNGMTMTTAPVTQPPAPAINIDYLVPSVKVAWLWEQIFTKNEFYCNGSIFDSPDFNNLWMTYPKGILSIENEELLFESSSYSFIGETTKSAPYVRKYFARYNNTATYNETMNNNGQIHLIAPQTGKYKLEISGRLNTRKQLYNLQNNPQDISIPAPCRIILGKNAINSTALTVIPSEVISMYTPSSTEFSKTLFITLNQGESICLGIGAVEEESYRMFTIASGSALKVKLTKIEPGVFDFNDAFSEFTVRDFLNEIVCRYGLTMYKDKYSKTLTFVTLQELFRESVVIDLSDKYVKKVSENYLYGSYAQQNWFRYNYHDKESSYNDGFLTVANTNLPEKRDVIKSKLYSPNQRTVTLLGRPTNVYRLWDKEVVEDPQPGEAALT